MNSFRQDLTRRGMLGGLLASGSLPVWARAIPKNPDVVVIGAGSAGLSAARKLIDLGKSVVVVEGSRRIGGRAFTDTSTFGIPFDHGCSWLQGPDNLPYLDMAREWGFDLLEHSSAGEALFVGDRRATRSERHQSNRAWTQISSILDSAGRKGLDVAASDVVPNDIEFSGSAKTWIGAMDWGVDFADLSTQDYWHSEDVDANYLIREGYGTLVVRMGQNLPVVLNTPALEVDWSGAGVKVHTPAGRIRAKACILTVSTGVLNAGTIRFTPQLPVWKQEAIANLPTALLAKITLQFDGQRFGLIPNQWLTYKVPNEMPAEACFFLTWPFGSNLMIGFVGGAFGWELSGAGPQAAIDFGLEQVVRLFGSSVRRHFVMGHLTGWAENPWTLGAYSAARPGHFSARSDLARSVANRLFFAGEAVAAPYATLCGGAFLSGQAVAREVADV